MQNQIIDIMKSIGIFTVISQIILHFCARAEYEKYAKVLTSLMLLTMLIVPIGGFLRNDYSDSFVSNLEEVIETYEEETEVFRQNETDRILNETQVEVARQLDIIARDYGYHVLDVQVVDSDNSGLKIVISTNKNAYDGVSPIIIGNISKDYDNTENISTELIKRMADMLKTDTSYLEVIFVD